MKTSQSTEQPIITLEETIAHLEVTVEVLNTVVTEQTQQLQDLQRQVQLMYNYLHANADDGIAPFDLMADRPPHY